MLTFGGRMNFLSVLSYAAMVFSLTSMMVAAGKNTASASVSANDPAVAALQKDVPELMKDAEIPGMQIAVVREGKTFWLQSYGVKDIKTKAPVKDDTVFNVGSLSKPVFSYGVLKLVDEGKLDLDAPLSKYLPKPYIEGDPQTSERLQKITARIVLSHRTGFPKIGRASCRERE